MKTVLAFALLLCLSTCVQAEIHVGLAMTDITPPVGGLTTGYSSARPTDGVLH